MKVKIFSCFHLLLKYVKNDYILDPNVWEVRDLLGSIYMPDFIFESDSPTSDPAYWYDWKELVEEELEKDNSILDEINGLTLEQGLVAMEYFLHYRYWVKNNDMLLKDAYEDLVAEYNANKDDLENSQLWQEWLVAVNEGKKFDKIFKGDRE